MTDLSEIKAAFDENAKVTSKSIKELRDENAELLARIEEMETSSVKPELTGEKGETREEHEHKKLFEQWIRNPRDSHHMQELGNFEHHARKAMSVGSNADGGFAVPSIWLREIERHEKKFSPVRSLVRVIQVDSADVKLTANIRGTDSGWVGEAGPRPATNTSQLRQVVPSFGELYAYVSCSEWASDDTFFNMQSFLAEEVAQQVALAEGEAVIRGSGTLEPKGILDEAPTTRADFDSPYRDNEIEYINADSDSPYAVSGDGLIDLCYRVASQYRANGTWVMNSAVLAEVRKLKSTDGVYLWQPGLGAGQPPSLLGFPVQTWEQMENVDVSGGSNPSFPIFFGDFRRGYVLADRVGLRVTVDSNITTPGTIKFYFRKRVGGCLYNVDAIKAIRTAA